MTPVWPSTTAHDREIFTQAPSDKVASHVTGSPRTTLENSLEQRDVNPDLRLYSYKFTHHDDAGEITFNISLFMSNCKTGVSPSTVAGIYTFYNGTTIENATVGDISADLLELEREDTQERMAHHVLRNARFLSRQSNNMLDHGLICKPSQTHRRPSIHDELRRRLLSWSETRIVVQEYTTIIVSSLIAAGISGIITGLGASYNLYLKNPGHPEEWNRGDGERSIPFNNTASNALLVEKCRSSQEAYREMNKWGVEFENLGSDAKKSKYFDDLVLYFQRGAEGKPPRLDPNNDEDLPKNNKVKLFLFTIARAWLDLQHFPEREMMMIVKVGEAMGATTISAWIDCTVSDTMSNLAYNIHNKDIEDYRIAKLQARNTGIISAITTFCASLSANIIVDLSTRRRMRYVEAFPSTVYIVMMRRALRDWARAQAREGNSPLMSTARPTVMPGPTTTLQSVAAAFSTSSQTSSTSARPSDPPSSPPCVSEENVVVHVREIFGVRLLDAIPDAADMMGANFREIEMAVQKQLNTQGRCLVPDVSLFAF